MSILGHIATTPLRIVGGIIKLLVGLALAFVIVVVGGVNLFVLATTSGSVTTAAALAQTDAEPADAIIVLGASVYADGTPSAILKDRLDDAAALYAAGAAPKIIVSGDNREEHYNESAAMKEYLVNLGIPSEDVFCDYAGFSTYESMYRARYVFGCESVIIATQSYHLPRAIYCAQGLGMKATGVAAGVGHTYENQTYYDIREIFSRVKDAWQVLVNAQPTFTGDAISLAGSGDAA